MYDCPGTGRSNTYVGSFIVLTFSNRRSRPYDDACREGVLPTGGSVPNDAEVLLGGSSLRGRRDTLLVFHRWAFVAFVAPAMAPPLPALGVAPFVAATQM